MEDNYWFEKYDEITTLEELEDWMKNFMFLIYDQRKRINDLSIERDGINMYTKYDRDKAKYLQDIDVSKLDESEHSALNIPGQLVFSDDDWKERVLKAKNTEIGSNLIVMVDTENLYNLKYYNMDTLNRLKTKYDKFVHSTEKIRRKSNALAKSLFGLDNYNLKSIIFNYIYSKYENGEPDMMHNLYSSNNKLFESELMNIVDPGIVDNIPEKPNVMPFFTPDDMNRFGVYSGNGNLYYPIPDNTRIGDMDTREWFDSYQITNGTMLPLQNEWVDTLNKLYSDYDKIKESGNMDKILSRKQSILELGWNPEINFNEKIYSKTNLLHKNCEKFQEVDLSSFYKAYSESQAISEESDLAYANNSDIKIKPIFILLFCANALISKVIKAYTHSLFSHSAIGLYPTLTSFYSFCSVEDENVKSGIHMGFNIETPDKYLKNGGDINFQISAVFVTHEQWTVVNNVIKWYIKNKYNTHYNFKNLFRMIYRGVQKTGLNTDMICSQFVYTILKLCNISGNINKATNLVTPQDIAELEDKKIYKLYFGKLTKFKPYKARLMIKDILSANNFEESTILNKNKLSEYISENTIYEFKNNVSNKDILNTLTPRSIFTERVKDIHTNDKGDIVIRTVDDVNTEFFKCHKNLITFEKTKQYNAMKDELCKLKYLDNYAMRKMKNKYRKDYKEYADAHARIMNDFIKYLRIVTEHDPEFNFSEYYKKSEWYDGEIIIDKKWIEIFYDIVFRRKK